MTDHRQSNRSQAASDRLLWFGVAAGPVAWGLLLLLAYLMAETLACDVDYRPVVVGLVAAALALNVAGGLAAWRSWTRLREGKPLHINGSDQRQEFMALFGVAMNVLTLVGIIYLAVPLYWIDPCARF